MIRDNPKMVVGMCRGIAKAVHFGLHNPDAAVRIHWKLYPQSKPQGSDEAKLLRVDLVRGRNVVVGALRQAAGRVESCLAQMG